jgi:amino acid transporter
MSDIARSSTAPRAGQEAHHTRTVTLWSLVAISYFSVAGGPEGTETIVRNAGAGLAVIGIIMVGLVWSIPIALMTAELSTMFPENGGYTLWVGAAFGARAGWLAGWLQFTSSAVDAALYPTLFVSYFKAALGISGDTAVLDWAFKGFFLFAMLALNLSGIGKVGHGSVLMMLILLAPFAAVIVVAFSGVFTGITILQWSFSPAHWLEAPRTQSWGQFLVVLLWNMGWWEGASVCAGEIKDVAKVFPRALALVFLIVLVNYILPILAFAGLDSDWDSYDNGYYISIARRVGGEHWGIVLGVAQCFSAAGLYTSAVVKTSYQLCGMSEQGMLPAVFSRRLASGAPWLALMVSVAVTVALLPIERFEAVVAVDMHLYCAAVLLETAALLRLRARAPDRARPFRIPADGAWLCAFFLPAAAVSLFGMFWAAWDALLAAATLLAAGAALVALLEALRLARPRWFAGGSEGTREGPTGYEMRGERAVHV